MNNALTRTAPHPRASTPTPTSDPTSECVVETGSPKYVATDSHEKAPAMVQNMSLAYSANPASDWN